MTREILSTLALAALFSVQAGVPRALGSGNAHRKMNTAQLHQLAGKVSVQVRANTPSGISTGSGTWISEEYVATCWHVVKDGQGTIEVRVAVPTWYDQEKQNLLWGSFYDYEGVVTLKDIDTDVAILKVNNSPFKKPQPIMLQSGNVKIGVQVAVARPKVELPKAGTLTALAGFPLGRPEVLTQFGNVSGTGLVLKVDPGEEMQVAIQRRASAEELRQIGDRPRKHLRVFVAVVSNPANSGGPVLDEAGNLIGLLQGNLLSPSKDESDRAAIYVRPKRDEAGNLARDAAGQTQFESAQMLQNSGISIVIPVMFVMDLLREPEKNQNPPLH